MSVLIEDKVVIITGAGDGIGRATARLLAAHGARIVLSDFGSGALAEQVAEELRAEGARVVYEHAELGTPDGAQALVGKALTSFGRVDVLINGATITRSETLLALESANWRSVLGVRLDGTLFSCQAAARVMQRQGGGRIVNVTGYEGLVGAFSEVSAAAATAAVYGLTRAMSVELQRHGISVNAVAPLTRTREAEAEGADLFTPEHVAPVMLWLASDLCGERTGLVVGVAGSRVSIFRVVESQGRTKENRGIWSPEEITEHWDSITKIRI